MKLTVYREIFFSSAHKLRNYNGKCENLHGHNWRVRLYLTAKELDDTGFILDFKDIDKILKKITNELDHQNLNDIEYFDKINPTAENIAIFIFNKAKKEIDEKHQGINIQKVSVWESEKSCASVEV